MRRFIGVLLGLAVSALSTGCDAPTLPGASPAPPVLTPARAGPAEVRIDETRNGGEVALAPGELLIVELPAIPSTGFGWQLAPLPPQLELKSQGQPDAAGPGGAVGKPARHRVVLVARQPGRGRLQLDYRRPWETGVPPGKTFSLSVVVN